MDCDPSWNTPIPAINITAKTRSGLPPDIEVVLIVFSKGVGQLELYYIVRALKMA